MAGTYGPALTQQASRMQPASNSTRGVVSTEKITEKAPTVSKTKAVSFTSGAESDQIFAISKNVSASSKESSPRVVKVTNDGRTPLIIMTGYETFSAAGTSAENVQYMHTMLLPGENFLPPVRAAISTHTDKHMLDGTNVDNASIADTQKTALASFTDGAISSASATTFNVDNNAGSPAAAVGFFHVGDLIRINDEIMRVEAIAANTGTEAQLTVKRGLYGSTAATHGDDVAINLPYFNAYNKFNEHSVVMTDKLGRFKATNLFGLARVNAVAAGTLEGITPGSLSLKFVVGGAQGLGLHDVTANTITGLAQGTYKLNVAVDGGSVFEDLSFTTDSSNNRFGGKNGLIEKIQEAFDTQYYTAGNLFEKKVIVSIVDGDVVFRSGSNTILSGIALANATDSSNQIWGNGRIPASANVITYPAHLPDDTTIDPITGASVPNNSAFAYDDGRGNIFGQAAGTINYVTGAIDFQGAPKEAQFVLSVTHSGAFSGALDAEATHKNSLVDIYANTTSSKWNGSVKVESWV